MNIKDIGKILLVEAVQLFKGKPTALFLHSIF